MSRLMTLLLISACCSTAWCQQKSPQEVAKYAQTQVEAGNVKKLASVLLGSAGVRTAEATLLIASDKYDNLFRAIESKFGTEQGIGFIRKLVGPEMLYDLDWATLANGAEFTIQGETAVAKFTPAGLDSSQVCVVHFTKDRGRWTLGERGAKPRVGTAHGKLAHYVARLFLPQVPGIEARLAKAKSGEEFDKQNQAAMGKYLKPVERARAKAQKKIDAEWEKKQRAEAKEAK